MKINTNTPPQPSNSSKKKVLKRYIQKIIEKRVLDLIKKIKKHMLEMTKV